MRSSEMTGDMSARARDIKESRARAILGREGVNIDTWTRIFMHVEATDWMLPLFYSLALKSHTCTIGEIGVRGGTSTVAFLLAAKLCNGRVYSMDLDPCPAAHHNIKAFDLDQYWEFQCGDSRELDFPEPLDVLFIDGDHSYEGVFADYERHSQSVKDGGVILFHDASGPSCPGSVQAVKEIGAQVIPIGAAGLGVLVK